VYFLDYRDSGMPGAPENEHPQALTGAPVEEVAARIVSHMRRLRPQVVITFDPIGGYKHPDHIAVHRATVRAFHLAGDPDFIDPENLAPHRPQKLYYHVFSKRMLQLAVRLMPLFRRDPRKFGRNGDIDLLDIAQAGNFPVHAVIDYRPVRKQRDDAMACHASQLEGGPPTRGPLAWVWSLFGGRETYMRAFPETGSNIRLRDLF
jgi:LmbE family N-acetylglucosaminyl deacetylase